MKKLVILFALSLVELSVDAQPTAELILVTVKNDRLELAKAIKVLNSCKPRMICVNVDLTKCQDVELFPSKHFDEGDTSMVITRSKSEEILFHEFADSPSLLMPSRLRSFGSSGSREAIGCDFLYPDNIPTGYVGFVDHRNELSQVDEIQISNMYRQEISYHFAVKIACQLNSEATRSFIKSHPNILPVFIEKERVFKTYRIEDIFKELDYQKKVLRDKIIIIGADEESEFRVVQTTSGRRRLTVAEIYANVAYQIIGE